MPLVIGEMTIYGYRTGHDGRIWLLLLVRRSISYLLLIWLLHQAAIRVDFGLVPKIETTS